MSFISRVIKHWKAVRAVDRLEKLMKTHGTYNDDRAHTMQIVRQALHERSPLRHVRSHIHAWKAAKILTPCMWRCCYIWNQTSWSFLAAHYPKEWNQAIAVYPEAVELLEDDEW